MFRLAISSAVVVVSLGLSDTPADADTVLYYEFEEGPQNQQASLVLDSGPNDISGTALQVGAATRPIYRDTLPAGLQLEFFGNGGGIPSAASYVQVDDTGVSPLDLTGPLTVEAIIRPDAIRQQVIVRKRGGLAGSGYFLDMHDDGHVSFRLQDDLTRATSSVVLQPETTYHVAGTWNGSTIKIYVNHQFDGSFGYDGPLVANDDELSIGALLRTNGTIGQGYAGLIDSVRISDAALTRFGFLPFPGSSPLSRTDTFGAEANRFTIDFMPISGNTNPTVEQVNAGTFAGFGIVDYDYYIGAYEITNDQWNKFKAELGVAVTGTPLDAYDEGPIYRGTNVPTGMASWYEAAQFVNWLNTSTGHQPAYRFTGTQGTSDYTFAAWSAAEAAGGTNLYRHKDAFYFLPTDDEWFKAAYWNGTRLQDLATQGDTLHQGNGTSGTGWNYSELGLFFATDPPGPWAVGSGSEELNGTYDMMGNAWEWMENPWDDPSYGADSRRGIRGGNWYYGSNTFHASSFSPWNSPTFEEFSIGFRVARRPDSSTTTAILDRHIFYNDSTFGDAIATDKTALLPGETASFANYTSYDLGINGIMIDVTNLADPHALNVETIGDYLRLRVGNDDNPDSWSDAPAVQTVNVQQGEGDLGSDRITLTWTDRAISDEWLQVTLLANEFTGLEEDGVFYFGNAIADAGTSETDAKVDVTDLLLARNNPRTFLDPAEIDFPYDYNRDQRVNTTDLLLARNNTTNFLTDLNLITVPGNQGTAGTAAVPEPPAFLLSTIGAVGLLALGWRKRNKA